MSKYFVVAFGAVNSPAEYQLKQNLCEENGILKNALKDFDIEIHSTIIKNLFFIIDKQNVLTEQKVATAYRDILFQDSAFILLQKNSFEIFIKEVSDDSHI